MKSFLNTYLVLLALMETIGLPVIFFVLSRNVYVVGAVAALVLAVPVSTWFHQETKLEDLEKRLRDLENKENQS